MQRLMSCAAAVLVTCGLSSGARTGFAAVIDDLVAAAKQYNPSSNMTKEIGKIIGRAAAGIAPEWDVMAVTDGHDASLRVRKRHKRRP